MWEALERCAEETKRLAKELNVLVYLIAQQNEDDDVKYSKALKEAADFYIKWTDLKHNGEVTEMIVEKARRCEPFNFQVKFDGDNAQFVDLD